MTTFYIRYNEEVEDEKFKPIINTSLNDIYYWDAGTIDYQFKKIERSIQLNPSYLENCYMYFIENNIVIQEYTPDMVKALFLLR